MPIDPFVTQMQAICDQAEAGCSGFVARNSFSKIRQYAEKLIEDNHSDDLAVSLRATLALYGLCMAIKSAAARGELKE